MYRSRGDKEENFGRDQIKEGSGVISKNSNRMTKNYNKENGNINLRVLKASDIRF
jgi:predicted DNA binding CopG/RHH family protein